MIRPWRSSAILLCFLVLVSCHSSPPPTSTPAKPLPQRGYLWQRYWSDSVKEAVRNADAKTDGVVVLGAEIAWEGPTARTVSANIDWAELSKLSKPCSIGVRVAPFSGSFQAGDERVKQIEKVIRSLLDRAREHQVQLKELQLDFDCPQSKLADYQAWLREIKPVISPTRFVITTLPAWLDEPSFPGLVSIPDSYVLQVHSVPTIPESGHAVLCDTALARLWVGKASALGLPFSVSLPTYWCLAGYNPEGHLISVAMDSVQPAWPPGTRTLEYSVDHDEIADLVHDWLNNRPKGLQEILWYRLPVATDERNWHWPTLLAVMQGRRPSHLLQVVCEGSAPVDFRIRNSGEAEERLNGTVRIQWSHSALVSADSLPGWTFSQKGDQAEFTPQSKEGLRLSPEAEIAIGWIRFDTKPELETSIHHETPPAP